MKNEKLWLRLRSLVSLRPCSDLVRPLLKHPCFISARIKNALHNLSLPLKPPASPQCFTIPPQNFKIRAIGATTIIHYSFFIIHHSLSSPTTPPTPPSPPPHTIHHLAPPNFKFAPSAQPQLFIIHFSSFIIHYLRRQPRHSHHHRHSSLSLAPHYQKSKSAP